MTWEEQDGLVWAGAERNHKINLLYPFYLNNTKTNFVFIDLF